MLPLFDVQCGFGGAVAGQRHVTSADELIAEMHRLSIGRALVRTAPANLDQDIVRSNARLYAAARQYVELVPCPVVLPADADSLQSEPEQVADAIAHGAAAVCLRPEQDRWSLRPWASGKLFAAIAERRMPVYCAAAMVALNDVAELAGKWPEIPFIIAGVDYRSQRVLTPLLAAFANTLLSLGSNFAVHQGIEQMAADVGAERLLFGTGLPDVEAGPAISQLLYADLSADDLKLAGHGNMERLVEGIRR